MTAAKTPDAPTVYQALSAVMAEVSAVGKARRNAQQNFDFRGIDDVMNALHGPLAKHGIVIVPSVLERLSETRQTAKGAAMNVVHLHVAFAMYGPAGDRLEPPGSAWGEAMDSADKSTGKAHSMALKTFLLETFMVPTVDLEDADAGGEPAAPAQQPNRPPDGWETWEGHDDYIGGLRALARAFPAEAKPAAKEAFLEATGGLDPADNASWQLPKKIAEDYHKRLEQIEADLDRRPKDNGKTREEMPF